MSNKLLAIVLVIIVIFLIIIAFIFTRHTTTTAIIQKNTLPPTPTIFTLKETKITLTSSGFSPKRVTIKKGEEIIWTNKSGKSATINSADHPTHKKFPEINLGEFDNDQSINHVFTKVGTFEYHNHYNPEATGTISVE